MKTIVITSGADWYDASFDILNIPDGFDIKAAGKDYSEWRRNWRRGEMEFLSFVEWLKAKRGCTPSNIEVFDVDEL